MVTPEHLDELDRLWHEAVGETFLPVGWRLIVGSIPDLIAAARREAALREALAALRKRLAMAIAGPSDLSAQSLERRDAYEHVLALIDALLSEVPQ